MKNYQILGKLILFLSFIFTLAACKSSADVDNYQLQETISAQSTWIAHLSTQVDLPT